MKPDIHRLLHFQQLLLQFSQIQRITYRYQNESYIQENDSEHSYNLAMTAWFLTQYFTDLDKDLVLQMALAHDLVEVHAGDTYIFADAADLASKHKRESDALRTLESDWHDFAELTATIRRYESKTDPEALFVYALDKIMPIMLTYISEGYVWKKNGITLEKLHEAKYGKVAMSPEIQPYYDQLYKLLLNNQQLFAKS